VSSDVEQRVSEADRDRAVTELRDHSVAGRLTLEELSDRIESAYAARTKGELERVTADLPAAPAARRSATRWIVALIGDVKRTGRWRLAEKSVAVLGIGDLTLDLRGAEIEAPESTITVVALIGDVSVVVPDGVDVEIGGVLLIGDRTYDAPSASPHPGAPVVHLRVFALIGDVRVRVERS
jgi:uncharacterized protein DUF1707/cell wall-active antibiotic response 4TMS protein YvqF